MVFFEDILQTGMEINKFTLTIVLLACAKSLMTKGKIQVHFLILKTGLYMDSVLKDALISTYAKIGYIQMSENLFEETGTVKSPGTWWATSLALLSNII